MSTNSFRIYVHPQMDGVTYELDPVSKALVEKHAKDTQPASRLFISFGDKTQLEWTHGPVWKQVASLLTGLSWIQLSELGNVVFIDPKTDKPIEMAEQKHE